MPVAESAEVTTVPRPVEVAGRAFVAVRLAEDAPASLVAAALPAPAGPAVGGERDRRPAALRLPRLGVRRDRDVRAAALARRAGEHPAAGAPGRGAAGQGGGRPALGLRERPADGRRRADGLRNTDPRLRGAWHPAALSDEVGAEPYEATVVGLPYVLRRTGDGLIATPEPAGLTERWGMVWLAPEPPRTELFDDPDAEDAAYVGAWLPPSRTEANAGFVADNFLDVAHFPFVHIGTFGAEADKVVEPAEVQPEPDGFRSVQEQWFDNPEDPGVEAGIRPLRQRRRATYVYRAPFQLLLRLEELDAGSVKTILFLALPETDTSTRIYTKMLLHNIGGELRPGPETVAREVAFEEAVLAEDLALQAVVTVPGLPLDMRTELHVRADRLGVALRRELTRFLAG